MDSDYDEKLQMETNLVEPVLEQHNLWLASKGALGKCADFTQFLNLAFVKFVGMDLRCANFSGMHLGPVKFWRCNLEGANFENTELMYTDFEGSYLRGANFEKAEFFAVCVAGADMRAVRLKGARIVRLREYGESYAEMAHEPPPPDITVGCLYKHMVEISLYPFPIQGIKVGDVSLVLNIDKKQSTYTLLRSNGCVTRFSMWQGYNLEKIE